MELLAGPTDPSTVRRIEDRPGTRSRAPYAAAATVRSLTNCLIAAVAVRHDPALWHGDEDDVRIAGVSDLEQRDLR